MNDSRPSHRVSTRFASFRRRLSLTFLAATVLFAGAEKLSAEPTLEDPLAPLLEPHLESMVEVMLKTYGTERKYVDADFPMSNRDFERFQEEVRQRFISTLGLEDWVVKDQVGKKAPLKGKYVDHLLKTIKHHDIEMEIHLLEIPETGMKVPAVICLPNTSEPRPGVCVFSGHTFHGLRDLVLDLESYQSGIAVRLAQAGLVTIAVEKIDTGYLSRDGLRGIDEEPVATFGLYWGQTTRAHQLMACVAASEILASHPRVDETKIGATGVSLGGWLSVQTAMLTDRVRAVADWGRKTVTVPLDSNKEDFTGMRDLCHILPGMLSVCDRNLMSLAYCPRPLLAGHGSRDKGSHEQAAVHYRDLYAAQYASLGHTERFQYHIHNSGDTMPVEPTIDYFKQQFGVEHE